MTLFDFLGIIGLIGFIVFIVLGLLSVIRKTGKAKKQFIIAGILFIVFFIGAVASGPSEEGTADKPAKAEAEQEEAKEEKKAEIAPSVVADITSAITVGMEFDAFIDVKDNNLNVEQPDSLSIGNGNVGTVLQATDGLVVVGTDGEKVLSVETFATLEEAKAHSEKLYAEAEAAKEAEKLQKFEESKLSLSGSGDAATELIELKAGFAVFEGSYSGSRNFIVQLMDENGNNVELLVNEIGAYNGKTFAIIKTDGNYYLNVKASGSWNFSIYQSAPPNMVNAPTELSGSGDDVVFINAKSGNYKFTSTHQGSSNFIVRLNGTGLLVNEIGNYNGSTREQLSTSGVYAFVVNADGKWSIKIEK